MTDEIEDHDIDPRRISYAARRSTARAGHPNAPWHPTFAWHIDDNHMIFTTDDTGTRQEVGRCHIGYIQRAHPDRIRLALIELAEGLDPWAPNPTAARILEALDRGEDVIQDPPGHTQLLAQLPGEDVIGIPRAVVVEGWPHLYKDTDHAW